MASCKIKHIVLQNGLALWLCHCLAFTPLMDCFTLLHNELACFLMSSFMGETARRTPVFGALVHGALVMRATASIAVA